MDEPAARRPLKTRSTRWAHGLARWLTSAGVSPNAISLISIVFAGGAAAAFLGVRQTNAPGTIATLFVVAAVCIQLRLLCNLMDGMVAVEGGKKTPTGEIYNDLPDRIADPLILVPAGYAVLFWFGPCLGWSSGLMALMTAYVRMLGGSMGLPQDFGGPMAKPHRMAVATVAALLEALLAFTPYRGWAMTAALVVIVLGAIATTALRTGRMARGLHSR